MKARRCLFALACVSLQAAAAVSLRDDAGVETVLARPAQRVVSLAPHATELLFAAGGATRIVGAVSHSDYPPAARTIPRVGDNRQVDVERLLTLKPDLIVAWRHDAFGRQMEQLRGLGIPLFYSEPRTLGDIPRAVLRLGQLMGTQAQAQKSAGALQARLDRLAARYRNRPVVRVFYQVWDRPLYTLNGRHIVSDAIRLCGGENVFSDLAPAAPIVDVEAVLQQDPEVVISGARAGQAHDGLALWRRYPALQATRRGNLFAVDADLTSRAGPRIVDGAERICARLEQARQKRKSPDGEGR